MREAEGRRVLFATWARWGSHGYKLGSGVRKIDARIQMTSQYVLGQVT